MAANKKSDPSTTENIPADKNISIGGNVVDSVVIAGNNNVVNKQTIFQKIINLILPTDSESMEQRNRRILLGHVENAWIKGVLDASLHGAALLDLGIKQDPEAVTKYPWAIKKESTDETLPAGTSMLEIFENIGMGRSLLILGAPGSGKTTMLLELARQLIAHARTDMTDPIPMVFNLASWTEKLSLADWLAQELNNLYSVPRKTAPDWVKGNKLLLLLDGLDEVRQESRTKCVEAINAFRKEHGLTSLAVCSRSQDYADLNAKLSFEGAIEVQPLTQKQITEFFNRFGDEMAGIKQALEKDSALREMAETPLFLSIVIMAYRDKQDVDILVMKDEKAQRKHLFNTYIERIFEHPRAKNMSFKKQDVLYWLAWLALKMKGRGQSVFYLDHIDQILQPHIQNILHLVFFAFIFSGIGAAFASINPGIAGWFSETFSFIGIVIGFVVGFIAINTNSKQKGRNLYEYNETLRWSWKKAWKNTWLLLVILTALIVLDRLIFLFAGPFFVVFYYLLAGLTLKQEDEPQNNQHKFTGTNLGLVRNNSRQMCAKLVGWFQQVLQRGSQLSRPAELLKWSLRKAGRGLVIGLMIGLIAVFIALFVSFVTIYIISRMKGFTDFSFIDEFQQNSWILLLLLRLLIFFVVILGVVGFLLYGLASGELETRDSPNQGIRKSLESIFLVWLISIGIFGAISDFILIPIAGIFGLSFGSSISMSIPYYFAGFLFGALTFGSFFGFVLGVYYGGYAVIYHYILRIILYRSGHVPLNYVRFLDHCVDLIFLRRVGGGYIFVHRLLMEHFAEMYVETPTSKGN